MTTMIRHGGEAHVMRPDRVYKTSVLAPMVGYQPQRDVQAVAQAFTQGPPLGTMLRGLGEPTSLWERIKAVFARGRAVSAMAKEIANNPAPPGGRAQAAASQIAPQQQAQMALLAHLAPHANNARGPLAQAMHAYSKRRWFSFYKAG